MEEKPKCKICGEPMPAGEEMFNYHGYSGDCPKPPLPKPALKSVVEYFFRDTDGEFFIDVHVDRNPWQSIGFDTKEERQRAHEDLLNMNRASGAIDVKEQ